MKTQKLVYANQSLLIAVTSVWMFGLSAQAGPKAPVIVEGWASGRGSTLVSPSGDERYGDCSKRTYHKDIPTALKAAREEAESKAVGDAVVKCATHPDGLDEGPQMEFKSRCDAPFREQNSCALVNTVVCTASLKMRCVPRKAPRQSSRGVQSSKMVNTIVESNVEANGLAAGLAR